MKRIAYLDFLRAFATIGVVILHTAAFHWSKAFPSVDWFVLNFFDSAVRWTVPIFVMISGALFLDPQKEFSIRRLYSKNLLRIVTAFLFWSLIFCSWFIFHNLRKYGYDFNNVPLHDAIRLFVTGEHHLWFLWMIAGLYILLPILRLINSDKRITRYFLILVFISVYILPFGFLALKMLFPSCDDITEALITNFNKSGIATLPGFALYFILGHKLACNNIPKNQKQIIHFAAACSFVLIIIGTYAVSAIAGEARDYFYAYTTPFVLIISVSVFILAKDYFLKGHRHCSSAISTISAVSFGIYLIHPLFINMMVATPFFSTPAYALLTVPVVSIIVFLVSFAASWVLNRIPGLRRYIV